MKKVEFQISDHLTDDQARQVFSRATGSTSAQDAKNSTIERENGCIWITSENLCYKTCSIFSSGAVSIECEVGKPISFIRMTHVFLYYKELGLLDAILDHTQGLRYPDGRSDEEKFSLPIFDESYWNRCKALGNSVKDKTELFFKQGRFVIFEQSHPIAFIYENKCIGTPAIIEAILSMFEAQIKEAQDSVAITKLIETLSQEQ